MPVDKSEMQSAKGNDEILVLPSWYPNRLDEYAGDFVKRHVEAIAQTHKQFVLFVVKDDKGAVTKDVLETRIQFPNFIEVIIYYHTKKTGISFIDKILSHRKYLELYKTYLLNYIKEEGLPRLSHVHIAMKAGLAAVWLKKRMGVPYVLSEHWTGYLPESIPSFKHQNPFVQKGVRKIVENATIVTAVSEHLAGALHDLFPNTQPVVIPNVVNSSIFYPTTRANNKPKRFLHASTMNYAKNFGKILEALSIVKSNNFKFEMDVFGPVQQDIINTVKEMHLDDCVFFKGNVGHANLAREMQGCDALIHFSKVETFGCVVAEAMAAGIPVFISDILALTELIRDKVNGFVVSSDDSVALADKIMAFLEGRLMLAQPVIENERFSYESVAQRFSQLYAMSAFDNTGMSR